jgi:hypothetical protein
MPTKDESYIPEALAAFTPEQLYKAAYRKEMANVPADPNAACFCPPTFDKVHEFIHRPPAFDPPAAERPRDTIDRPSVLHILYELGATRSEGPWRNFAVEAYRAIKTMASDDEMRASAAEEARRP